MCNVKAGLDCCPKPTEIYDNFVVLSSFQPPLAKPFWFKANKLKQLECRNKFVKKNKCFAQGPKIFFSTWWRTKKRLKGK